jgi:hypothetical protein
MSGRPGPLARCSRGEEQVQRRFGFIAGRLAFICFSFFFGPLLRGASVPAITALYI